MEGWSFVSIFDPVYIHINVHILIYIYMHISICIYTNINTHIYSNFLQCKYSSPVSASSLLQGEGLCRPLPPAPPSGHWFICCSKQLNNVPPDWHTDTSVDLHYSLCKNKQQQKKNKRKCIQFENQRVLVWNSIHKRKKNTEDETNICKQWHVLWAVSARWLRPFGHMTVVIY